MKFQVGDVVLVESEVDCELPHSWRAIVVDVPEDDDGPSGQIEVAWLSRSMITPNDKRVGPIKEYWDDHTAMIDVNGDEERPAPPRVTLLQRATYSEVSV